MDYDIEQDFSLTRKESIKTWALFHHNRAKNMLESEEDFSELMRQIKYFAAEIYQDERLFEINNWNYQGIPLLDNCAPYLYCQCTESERRSMSSSFHIFANDYIIDFKRYDDIAYDEYDEDTKPKFCINPVSGASINIIKDYRFSMNVSDPREIRNYSTLIEALKFLIKTFNKYGDKVLKFIDNQLRSIEQDLYFQDINNFLALDVYEFHLQVAIIAKDWVAFERIMVNSLLEKFYAMTENTPILIGKKLTKTMEVLSLNLLWDFVNKQWFMVSRFLRNWDMKEVDKNPAIKYVLSLIEYFNEGNYYFFLKKYYKNKEQYPLHNSLIEEFILNQVKLSALDELSVSYQIEKSVAINDFKLLSKHLYFKNINEYMTFCRQNLLFERYCWNS